MKKILAIIPARSKSKGIKNKNIKKIKGKELIYYTIKRAKESKLISDIISSTDSKIYSKLFKKNSIWTPSLRPERLAGDKSKIIDTLIYTTKIAEKLKEFKYDYIILLQPTAPNRAKGEIDRCIKKIINSKHDSLISLCSLNSCHPIKMKKIKRNLVKSYIKNTAENPNRQELEKLYVPSGNIYIIKRDMLIKKKTIIGRRQTYDLIKSINYVNIDTKDDFEIAKIKLKSFK